MGNEEILVLATGCVIVFNQKMKQRLERIGVLILVLHCLTALGGVALKDFFPYGSNNGDTSISIPDASGDYILVTFPSDSGFSFDRFPHLRWIIASSGRITAYSGEFFVPVSQCDESPETPIGINPFFTLTRSNGVNRFLYARQRYNPTDLLQASVEIRKYWNLPTFYATFIAVFTWINVDGVEFIEGNPDAQNSYQVAMITDGLNSFVIVNYNTTEWSLRGDDPYQYACIGLSAYDNSVYLPESKTFMDVTISSKSNVYPPIPGKFTFWTSLSPPRQPSPPICLAGMYLSAELGACKNCAADSYTPVSGLTSCIPCQAGKTSGEGASECESSKVEALFRSDYIPGFKVTFPSIFAPATCSSSNCLFSFAETIVKRLGAHPTCRYSADCKTLDVFMGPDSTIVPGEILRFTWTNATASLAIPLNLSSVEPFFVSPPYFSECNPDYLFSAAGTSGLYARSDSIFSWEYFVYNSSNNLIGRFEFQRSKSSSLLITASSFSSLRTIPNRDKDYVYLIFKVTVVNFLGSQGEYFGNKFIFFFNNIVSVSSFSQIAGSNLAIFVAFIRSESSCFVPLPENARFQLSLSDNEKGDSPALRDYLQRTVQNSAIFFIPLHLFDPGLSPFQFNILILSSTVEMYPLSPVTIPMPAFSCQFSSGSNVRVSALGDLILSVSLLPQRADFSDFSVSYSFQACSAGSPSSNETSSSCNLVEAFLQRQNLTRYQSSSILRLPSTLLLDLSAFSLQSTVLFASKLFSNLNVLTTPCTVGVEVMPLPAPKVSIQAFFFKSISDGAYLYSRNDNVRLVATATSVDRSLPSSFDYSWTCFSGGFQVNLDSDRVSDSPRNSPVLSLSVKGILQIQDITKMECSVDVSYKSEGLRRLASGSAQVMIAVGRLPILGEVSIQQQQQQQQLLIASVSSFFSEFPPLFFTFSAIPVDRRSLQRITLSSRQENPTLSFSLPAGTWVLEVQLSDGAGSEIDAHSPPFEVTNQNQSSCLASTAADSALSKVRNSDIPGALSDVQIAAHDLLFSSGTGCEQVESVTWILVEVVQLSFERIQSQVLLAQFLETLDALSQLVQADMLRNVTVLANVSTSFVNGIVSNVLESDTFFRLEFRFELVMRALSISDYLNYKNRLEGYCESLESTRQVAERALSIAASKLLPSEPPLIFNGTRFSSAIIPVSTSTATDDIRTSILKDLPCSNSAELPVISSEAIRLASSYDNCSNGVHAVNLHILVFCNDTLTKQCLGSSTSGIEERKESHGKEDSNIISKVFSAKFLSTPMVTRSQSVLSTCKTNNSDDQVLIRWPVNLNESVFVNATVPLDVSNGVPFQQIFDPCFTQTAYLSCGFFDKNSSEWSAEGCTTEILSNTSISCSCNHFTDFALFYRSKFKKTSSLVCSLLRESHRKILGFSCMFAVLSLVFLVIWGLLWREGPSFIIKRKVFFGFLLTSIARSIWTLMYSISVDPEDFASVLAILSLISYLPLLMIESFAILSWKQVLKNSESQILGSIRLAFLGFTGFNFFIIATLYVSIAFWSKDKEQSAAIFFKVGSAVFGACIFFRAILIAFYSQRYWSFVKLLLTGVQGASEELNRAWKLLVFALMASFALFCISTVIVLSGFLVEMTATLVYFQLALEVLLLVFLSYMYSPSAKEFQEFFMHRLPKTSKYEHLNPMVLTELSKKF